MFAGNNICKNWKATTGSSKLSVHVRKVCAPAEEFRRQCGPVIRAIALRSGNPEFKTFSNYQLNWIQVVPGATSRLH